MRIQGAAGLGVLLNLAYYLPLPPPSFAKKNDHGPLVDFAAARSCLDDNLATTGTRW
jgi:hypothetical protein